MGKKKHVFLLQSAHLFVPLASSKVLSLKNEKKSKHSFCISLTYSYLCNQL